MGTILVVDDDQNNRSLVRMVAEHAGHVVLEAADGTTALGLSALHQPNLVVLDLSMPKMSGPEFMRELRKDSRTRGIPVLLYTASEPSAAIRDFMNIYAIAHAITKPSEPLDLMRAIERALRGATSPSP
jgi:two-component system phosphate regulon response regulator PhoB